MSGHVKSIILFLAFLANACASVTPPTGGPQDQTPPKLSSSVPENKSLNYKDRIISLKFDEEVELSNLQKELIITPYTENPYENKVDKNTITLEFEKDLEPNTTYTFNFRKSIKDLTEGNPSETSTLTFSTGGFLDSGSFSGTVVQLLNQKPEADTDVLLYRAADTGSVKTAKPFYVTRTDASGNYQFTNLATGAYSIFALKDLNNSLTYDQDTERIGFIADTIQVTANRQPVNLNTVRIDTRKPFIARRTPQADRAEIEYNEGLVAVQIRPFAPATDSLLYQLSESGRTITVYRRPEQKELKFISTATDSIGFKATDTVTIAFVKPYKAETAELFIKNGTNLYTPGERIVLTASHPIKAIELRAIRVLDDSTEVTVFDADKIELSEKGRKLILPAFNLPRTLQTFILTADSAKLTTATGHVFNPFRLDMKLATGTNTGSLSGTIITAEPNYVLQLLDKDLKVIKSQVNQSNFNFTNLVPNQYKLRLIVDKNANGKWDNASEDLKTLPEPILFYKEDLNIRANWEMEDIKFEAGKPVDNPINKNNKM